LAEIFRKIIKVFEKLLTYLMYDEEIFSDEAKIGQNKFIFVIFSGLFNLLFDLETRKIDLLAEIF
jgi:hypothetical protein